MIGGLLVAIGVLGMFLSGVPVLALPGRAGRVTASVLLAIASAVVLTGAAFGLIEPSSAALCFEWTLPVGRFAIGMDALSALFLLPVCVIPALGMVYGQGYAEAHPLDWPPGALTRIRLLVGLLAGSLALLVVARDSMLFLLAWEGMALGSFFLITVDDREAPARDAGWIYLIATHVGTLGLFAFFAILASSRGDTTIGAPGELGEAARTALFSLAVLGFGLKAGLVPFHVWLPPAHAAAPSHVSAMLSGVVTKMGLYGLIRTIAILPDPPLTWGVVLLALGAVSAVGGMAMALGQGDLKRMLAYSTIENVGIVTVGLGVAVIGRAGSLGDVVLLGLSGALLHVLAHAVFKPMLFFGAGAIIHATGTRELDRMGGLTKLMPESAGLFATAALAACALPPLLAFASEFLIYLAAIRCLVGGPAAVGALAAPTLALAGAMGLACFVRAYGAAFLGEPRAPRAEHACEPPPIMRWPIALLAAIVVVLGLTPALVNPLLEAVVEGVFSGAVGANGLAELVPQGTLTAVSVTLLAAISLVYYVLRRRMRRADFSEAPAWRSVPTWDCGYTRPTARMQYTATSFGASLVGLFPWIVRPRLRGVDLQGPFPPDARLERQLPDAALDDVFVPGARWLERRVAWVRVVQQGRLQLYILYILVGLLALFFGLAQ